MLKDRPPVTPASMVDDKIPPLSKRLVGSVPVSRIVMSTLTANTATATTKTAETAALQ
jgi:hypothetical protein